MCHVFLFLSLLLPALDSPQACLPSLGSLLELGEWDFARHSRRVCAEPVGDARIKTIVGLNESGTRVSEAVAIESSMPVEQLEAALSHELCCRLDPPSSHAHFCLVPEGVLVTIRGDPFAPRESVLEIESAGDNAIPSGCRL
ncbi:MAG: hypothetical protein QM765_46855 [Myxococcales bacterium]